jgi:hypothetical protein
MRYPCLALLVPALLPSIAGAQGVCADIPKFFARPPVIGEWAEISWQTKDKTGPDHVRMSVIKEEQRAGKRMYWFQMVMDEKGKRSIIQTLTPWDVTALGSPRPAEVVMKMGDRPAMKMSGNLTGQSPAAQADWREFCAKSTFVGEETVTVPGGTFKTRHYQSKEGDTWVSLDAPVWHLVRMTTPEGKTMILTAKGTGAKNEITEQPVDMKSMMTKPPQSR